MQIHYQKQLLNKSSMETEIERLRSTLRVRCKKEVEIMNGHLADFLLKDGSISKKACIITI